MEALQTGPGSSELLPRTTIRSSYESVKNRLKWLPGVPSTLSSVILPPPSPEPEPAELLFSDITTTTPPPTQSASETSTAATSVLSLPRIFTIQKLYVSPSMPINEKTQAVWTQQIRSRLGAVLFHSIHAGTCVQEFMMVGKGPNTLKPTILITCGDAATKNNVEKTIKSQAWLHELLKANHIGLVALVAKTPLSSGLASSNGSIVKLSESYAVQLLPSEAATSCGLGLLIGGVDNRLRQHCTLGGLLLINGEVLGLTAGHPFREIERNSMRDELLEASQVGEDLSDEESGTISSEPFIFNDDDGDVIDNLSASTVSLHENSSVPSSSIDEPPHRQQETSRPFLSSVKWYMPQAAVLPAPTSIHVSSVEDPLYNHDWALLETLPPSVTSRPNKVAHNDLGHDILIDRTVTGPACGEVTISIAGIGPQAGYLHFSPATMKIDKSVLDVQLITLEQVLPLGSSGAWVTLGDKLCGYIIAIRQDIPWAYMVAIEPILENIKRKLKTDDVRLPTATEIERQTVSFKATNGEVSNELDEETRAPTSEVNQTKTSGKSPKKPCNVQEWSTQRNTPELPSTEDRHLLGELRTEDEYYYPFELPERLVDMSHLPDQQEDKSLNEKSPVQDGAPQTPIVQPSLPHGTVSHKDKESRGLAIGQAAPVALTSIHNSCVPSISNPLVPLESQSVGTSNTPALLLFKTISLPSKTWHFLETVVLRTEYRRRMRGRRLYRHLFRPIRILRHLEYPGDYSVNIHTAILNDIQKFWYYVCLPLFIVGEVLLNILYFVVCFPFIFWVAHRHRDVLTDVRTLERQQRESIEMLGQLLDRYDDHELLEQRSVLEQHSMLEHASFTPRNESGRIGVLHEPEPNLNLLSRV